MKAVILAAGESKRFWPLSEEKHKSLIELMGKPLIYWTVESLIKSKIKDIIIVESPERKISKALSKYEFPYDIEYVVQEKPLGTGDAVSKVKEYVDDEFFVLNPYHFNAHKIIPDILEKARREGSSAVFLGKETDQPWLYGIFRFDLGKPVGIVEKPEKGKEPSNIRILGLYYLTKNFFKYLKDTGHHSFEHALNELMQNEETSLVISDKKFPTLKYPWHLLDAFKIISEEFIEEEKISTNSKIGKNVVIEGKVFIDDGAKIYENAVIKGPAYIGKNSIIGNNSLIRESHIGENNLIGANAEIARSVFLNNVHTHSGYFGDSVIGENTKIGAGVITANVRLDRKEIYAKIRGEKINTGKKKLGVILGHNTVVGINSSFMPGSIVGNNCIIGPMTIVKGTIESKSIVYSKIETVEKKNESDNV